METMKNFLIQSSNSVYAHNYENGAETIVNSFNVVGKISAKSAKSALVLFIEKNMYFNYNNENLQVVDGNIFYINLVDKENAEASKVEIEEWENGRKKLYLHHAHIKIFELVKVDMVNNQEKCICPTYDNNAYEAVEAVYNSAKDNAYENSNN